MAQKEKIDLDINTEISDDEFEYESSNSNINDISEDDNDDTEINTINDDGEYSIDNNDKTNFNDSITRSETKISMSDTFMDDDDDDDDDIFSISNPAKEMEENFQIPDNERISKPILTKYEKVRILGTRAKQISDGSKVFVKYECARSAMELAELELKYKMIPLKIKRPMPNGKYEIWKISELTILD